MNYTFVTNNLNSIAIIIFLMSFILLNYIQPSFLYNDDGSLRPFGIGQKRKTIIPVWLLSIILGILSYLLVLYYISLPKFR